MIPFTVAHPGDVTEAVELGALEGSTFLGGGTNLVDLMREGIERPVQLVDVRCLSREIVQTSVGTVMIGAAATNTAVAEHPLVRSRFPVISRAISAGASAQLRNMATVGGNLLQRTRCAYFYDLEGSRCNRRTPGQGCDARHGLNRNHAILGGSEACVAVHPSDLCVALAALDATVHVTGPRGARALPLTELHRPPGDHPEIETTLATGELITGVELPADVPSGRSAYRKVRDRSSFAFAVVSVAAVLAVEDDVVCDVRLALGGVGTTPWRAWVAEGSLIGRPATEQSFREAIDAELAHAEPLSGNGFKIELAARTTVAVLHGLSRGEA